MLVRSREEGREEMEKDKVERLRGAGQSVEFRVLCLFTFFLLPLKF